MIHILYNWYLVQENINKSSVKKFIFWKVYWLLKKILPLYYKRIKIRQSTLDLTSGVVVSLTSFPGRIDVVHLTIKSIFKQSFKPNAVVLYLAKSQFISRERDLPIELLNLTKIGLQIKFCEDFRPHKKYLHSFKDFRESKIIVVDDDVIYPKDMLKTLVDNSIIFPNCIISNRVREIDFDTNHKLKPYRVWEINNSNATNPSKLLFATGVGGVLYKPIFFSEELFNTKVIKELCLNADDVWLKANSLITNTKTLFTNRYYSPFIEIPGSQKESLFLNNVLSADNDLQIQKVFDYFKIEEKNFN